MPSIVTTNVSQIVAPAPSTLQKTGAFISQGATTTTANTITLITKLADLTAILAGSHAITSITWLSSVATVTSTAPHGFTIGDTILITIAGATPTGYNGTFSCTITTTTAFTYPLVTNPGSSASSGTYTLEDVAELTAMGTTFFAQGGQQAVYVLELGEGTPAEGVTALTTYITNNPQFFYAYLVPRTWASEPTFITMVGNYENTTAKTYFFVTVTNSDYTSFTTLMKDVFTLVEAPGIPVTEFSLAAVFWVVLNWLPSTTNKVPPLSFSFLFGVTPYPTANNNALLTTYKTANVNYVTTGAEGGISDAMIVWGNTMDGNPFNYWYAIDLMNINCSQAIANTIINGSNNPINPLYYNQQGINVLEGVVAKTVSRAVTYGLCLFPPIQLALDGPILDLAIDDETYLGYSLVNAVPFITYSQENPSDYSIGRYAGLSVVFTPARGFTNIVLNLLASNFVAI